MTDMTIDMDSTVQGVCGHQEGAQKGYNPHKKGQLAYHPLLAFCAETKASTAQLVPLRQCLHQQRRS